MRRCTPWRSCRAGGRVPAGLWLRVDPPPEPRSGFVQRVNSYSIPTLDFDMCMCHPSVNHDPDGRLNCRGSRRTYYMGGVVFAPEPPFAMQQIATAPLGVPDAYGETRQRQGWQVALHRCGG